MAVSLFLYPVLQILIALYCFAFELLQLKGKTHIAGSVPGA